VVESSGMLENSSGRNVDCVLDGRWGIIVFVVKFILSVSLFRMEKYVNYYSLNMIQEKDDKQIIWYLAQ